MTFSLEFDLLMIGVCTFIKKKNKNKKRKKKQKQKKNKKKTNNKKKQKKNKETKKRRVQRHAYVSYLTPLGFCCWVLVVGFIIGGLGEIFMRDELCESSLRSFIPWIMDDMY